MAIKKPKIAVNPPVFFTSSGLLVLFLLFGAIFTDTASDVFPAALDFVSTRFGWFYILSVAFFIGFAVWLVFSRYATVRLGPDDSRPEFSTPTWFSMLFSAGMGIGLLFYGVAEPIMQYSNPPVGQGETPAAAEMALPLTYFHWGIHAWAVYVLMALAIAYFSFRRQLPLAIRSAFYPLLGERIHGSIGHVIDIIAVFGTTFGLATSLGLGSLQINAGLNYLFPESVPDAVSTQLIIIAVITGAATISLVTGVDKGIRRLSELNMIIAALLMVFVFVVGPTLFILNSFTEHVGSYLQTFVQRTFWTDSLGDGEWNKSWTLFYWGWWIAWSPFVGMFVARISRGRTIREFILGVALVPTIVTFVWLSVFGDTAIYLELFEGGGIARAVSNDVDTAIYVMLEKLPLAALTSLLAATVVAVFFVTSSDSASFVVDMLTSGGHPDPPVWQRVFWAVTEGCVAGVLLAAAGKSGLDALQAAVVTIGLPFCVCLVIMVFSLMRGLRDELEPSEQDVHAPATSQTAAAEATSEMPAPKASEQAATPMARQELVD